MAVTEIKHPETYEDGKAKIGGLCDPYLVCKRHKEIKESRIYRNRETEILIEMQHFLYYVFHLLRVLLTETHAV